LSESSRSVICYIGIGSNTGDPVQNCLEAVDRLSACETIKVLKRSSLYRTEPVGFKDQPWFINAVVEIRTTLGAHALLEILQTIEERMGRVRAEKGGPRVMDLDILLYGERVIQDATLCVPHPEMHKRRFVLVPLNEIASYFIHPAYGVSIRGLLERLGDESAVIPLDAAMKGR
jgi:2-amino-4-hydroxy-6-hydroxymethyldihydropteridine diphosphokinase